MLRDDPRLRAMLRQIRRSLEDVAAIIPAPVLLELPDRQPDVSLIDRLQAVATSLRRATGDLLARTPLGGGSAEQVAGAGAGSVGSAIAVKAALVCLAVGGTAAVCVNQLLPGQQHARPAARTTTQAHRSKLAAAPVRRTAPVLKAKTASTPSKKTTKRSPATSSPAARPAASPAPSGSQEFTPSPGAASSAQSAAASAPSDGGGEFGP